MFHLKTTVQPRPDKSYTLNIHQTMNKTECSAGIMHPTLSQIFIEGIIFWANSGRREV
jgi:hypothetical protein